jgi:hypothetical protein
MAFSTTYFHFPRSWTQVIQFLTLIWQMSSHLYLGLPCDFLVRGFHLNIFLTVLVSGILSTWPNQLSLWALIWLNIFLRFIHYYIMNKLASIFILISTYELKMLSPFPGFTGRLKKMDTETCSLVAYNCGSTHLSYTYLLVAALKPSPSKP